MTDDRLDEGLRALPRAVPDGIFTARVIAEGRRRRQRRMRLRALALAAVTAAGAVGAVFWAVDRSDPELRSARETLRSLRDEHREIVVELARMREAESRSNPVIYVGGNEEVDLVLQVPVVVGDEGEPATRADERDRRDRRP